MKITPENLSPGEFIIITGYDDDEPTSMSWEGDYDPYYSQQSPRRPSTRECDGNPVKIEAISPPWVLVTTIKGTPKTIDIRETHITKANNDYVEAFFRLLDVKKDTTINSDQDTTERDLDECLEKKICPICRVSLVHTKRYKDKYWSLTCKKCGFFIEVI